MQRYTQSVFLLMVLAAIGVPGFAIAQDGQLFSYAAGTSTDYYHELIGMITGEWLNYGELFTTLQQQWFWKGFLAVITVIPVIFLLHYMIIGAKRFDHDGEQIFFFSLYTRIVHFVAAVSFTLLVITGLMIVFGNYLGGGAIIRTARYIHLASAIVFVLPAVLMFLMWVKDMLPQAHDIAWVFILGGYLSKKQRPVPAGKFNAGQKMYFWFATIGGGVMAYSGYVIWGMGASLDTVRILAIVHNALGMIIVAFYITHVYMSVFAIAGSINSIKTGYKPKHEVDILHSRYTY